MYLNMKDINEKLSSLKAKYKAKFKALDMSIKLDAKSLKDKLVTMNEFRGQITDQTKTFIPRIEHSGDMDKIRQDVDRMRKDIQDLRESKALLEGKASKLSSNIALAIAIIGIILAVIGFFIK